MKVKDLIKILNSIDQESEIEIRGCYGSIGTIEEVVESTDGDDKVCMMYSDICSG